MIVSVVWAKLFGLKILMKKFLMKQISMKEILVKNIEYRKNILQCVFFIFDNSNDSYSYIAKKKTVIIVKVTHLILSDFNSF